MITKPSAVSAVKALSLKQRAPKLTPKKVTSIDAELRSKLKLRPIVSGHRFALN